MVFSVRIEGSYDTLSNRHPAGKPSGGNAILSFLIGLQLYHDFLNSNVADDDKDPNFMLSKTVAWYRSVEEATNVRFFPTSQALLDSMWGDGGDPMECYKEDDYDFYVRHSSLVITKEQFLAGLRESRIRWKPIVDVAKGVELLLKMFKSLTDTSLEGFYQPTDTIPDFEALLANLELLAERGNENVRLNFS